MCMYSHIHVGKYPSAPLRICMPRNRTTTKTTIVRRQRFNQNRNRKILFVLKTKKNWKKNPQTLLHFLSL